MFDIVCFHLIYKTFTWLNFFNLNLKTLNVLNFWSCHEIAQQKNKTKLKCSIYSPLRLTFNTVRVKPLSTEGIRLVKVIPKGNHPLPANNVSRVLRMLKHNSLRHMSNQRSVAASLQTVNSDL